MPVEQTAEITHSAYELAWQEFINFAGLSVDERRTGRTSCARTFVS